MENKQNKPKISLSGSLATLAKKVQEDVEIENETVTAKEDLKKPKGNQKNDFSYVVELAKSYRENKPKPATIYVAENIKKDLERLKAIPDFDKIPLIAMTSAILDHFLSEHEDEIKSLLSEIRGRF